MTDAQACLGGAAERHPASGSRLGTGACPGCVAYHRGDVKREFVEQGTRFQRQLPFSRKQGDTGRVAAVPIGQHTFETTGSEVLRQRRLRTST